MHSIKYHRREQIELLPIGDTTVHVSMGSEYQLSQFDMASYSGAVRTMAETTRIGYIARMSMLLRQLARYVAQKVASNPEIREKAMTAASGIAEQAKQIAKEDDRAYAAGRAFRQTLDRLRNNR